MKSSSKVAPPQPDSNLICNKENLAANNLSEACKESSQKNRTLILHQPSNPEDQPMISINVIDSDNLNICMCSLMSEGRVPSQDFDIIDGSICPECRNIIKKQPQEHRCTLVSKRLLLSNNIIVNRIDTHYLNTYLDTRGEPYTPESVDSHTPYPEYEIQVSGDSEISEGVETDLGEDSQQFPQHSTDNNDSDEVGKKSPASETRGVVSPGDLKLRLEDLQRNSLNEINADLEINVFKEQDVKSSNNMVNSKHISNKNSTPSKKSRRKNGCFQCNIF